LTAPTAAVPRPLQGPLAYLSEAVAAAAALQAAERQRLLDQAAAVLLVARKPAES